MGLYKKESLESLRKRVDLIEVVGSYVPLKRAGSAYKALCPFHEEKTPSFILQKGDSHYHCFGCGAHGDAIAFLMQHLKMGFSEAVEALAEKFSISLEKENTPSEQTGPGKAQLKKALTQACQFYHFCLLYAEEAAFALQYLYQRRFSLEFIRRFEIGYAPSEGGRFQSFMKEMGFTEEELHVCGLISVTEQGRKRDFFSERITFPIRDSMGNVIGFSARKIREETFGGKYINTPETPLFKKSQVLFGLNYCRRRIAKEKKALIVEGQIDALKLIDAGFDYTVAGQGTAFGEGHVRELLNLGVRQVILALDGDSAGQEAAYKIGDLFQSRGVGVDVLKLPQGKDPDALLKEQGVEAFSQLLTKGEEYLAFCVRHLSKSMNPATPSVKNEIANTLAQKIDQWEETVMAHESKKRLAELLQIPPLMMGVEFKQHKQPLKAPLIQQGINPDFILETDLLRWLVVLGTTHSQIAQLIRQNITVNHFRMPICARLYTLYFEAIDQKKPCDLFTLAQGIEETQDQDVIQMILDRKINTLKAESGVMETIKALLDRNWMDEREAIKTRMMNTSLSEEEALDLARRFDVLKKNRPEIRCI